jgi:NADPH:quinone reductase-like Zn-dependent oxidoreductase
MRLSLCAFPSSIDIFQEHIDMIAAPGATIGCDYAGTVVEVGSKVQKKWQKGDRIAGFTHGGNSVELEDGSFAEYCVAKGGSCTWIW